MSNRLTRKGFTLIELLIVIAIIGILAALLFPVFASARDKGRQIACISNARQMGIGLYEYSEDYDDHYMAAHDNDAGDLLSNGVDPNPAHFQTWYDWTQPYIASYNVQECPSFSGTYPIENDAGNPPSVVKRYVKSTYLINDNIINPFGVVKSALSAIPNPASTILIAESPSGNTYFSDEGTGFVAPFTNAGPTGIDDLMCPESTNTTGPGEMHFVQYIQGQTEPACGNPAISAQVTCLAADGHAKSVLMNDTNDGGVTQNGSVLNDPPGGYGGLYVVGPQGELSFPGT